MRLLFSFIVLFVHSAVLFAQQADSVYGSLDSLINEEQTVETFLDGESPYKALNDSIKIAARKFSNEQIQSLKSDPELSYEQPPTVAESLWQRFWRWLGRFLDTTFDKAVHTNWGRLIAYAVGLALLVVLVMLMLKVNAFKILYNGHGASQKYNVLDENIHEMDFDQLISEAVADGDYRKGIRLLFLYALKLLSDGQLIHWESGKTNHDYLKELNNQDLLPGFNALSFYFEYAWYGNFQVGKTTFMKANEIFTAWRIKLR